MPFSMQQVLRPAIGNAGHHTKQVLHAQCYSRRMVCFHLGHRDSTTSLANTVRGSHSLSSPVKPVWDPYLPDFIAIQIYEPQSPRLEFLFQSTLGEDQKGIPLVAWPVTNHNRFRSQCEEGTCRSSHQSRVGVHFCWDVLHQIRLQEDGLATKAQIASGGLQ